MNNPWRVLSIPPTQDLDEVNRAYRALAQKYHPDRAKTPEKQRKYTIKFVQITRAYEEAQQQARTRSRPVDHDSPSTAQYTPGMRAASPWYWDCLKVLGAFAAPMCLAFPFAKFLVYLYALPEPNVLSRVFLACMDLVLGCFFGPLLFFFQMFVVGTIAGPLLGLFGLERHLDKLIWLCSLVLCGVELSLASVYCPGGIGRSNLALIAAIVWPPVYLLSVWAYEYARYIKVKPHYLVLVSRNE